MCFSYRVLRCFVIFLHCGAVLAGYDAMARPTGLPPAAKPNLIFILIDDLGYADLGVTGNKKVSTPNIDRLAEEGLLVEQFYANAPVCSASRAAFMTGQYQQRHPITSVLHKRNSNRERLQADWLPLEAPSLGRLFRSAGYMTAHIGKWHLGGGRDVGDAPRIRAYGFDRTFTSFEGLGDRYLIVDHPLSKQSAALGRGKIMWGPKHRMTEEYVNRSIRFIKDAGDKQFYLQLWLDDLHDWHLPSPKRKAEMAAQGYKGFERDFFAVLVEMDHQIGRLLDYLDQAGLTGETLIILTGDNGPTAWPRYYKTPGEQPPGDTGGLRGRKWSLYEGGIRQPLIVRWPGVVPPGIADGTSVLMGIDLYPTFSALLGKTNQVQSDGINVLGVLSGHSMPDRAPLFWAYGIEGNRSSYMRPPQPRDVSPDIAMRHGRWKLLVNADGTGAELYDLEADRAETVNLAGQHPRLNQEMIARALSWYDDVSRPAAVAGSGE